MEIGNNDVDNMLHDLGIDTPMESNTPSLDDVNSSMFSDSEISNIIEENSDYTEQPSEEEENNVSHGENQGEGYDDIIMDPEFEEEEGASEAIAVEEGGSMEEASNEENGPEVSVEVPENAKIPLNSPTLLIDESTSRFSGAEWFNEIQKQRIIVAGIGGIGSNLCFQLARMTPANITMYDDDNVETVNMAGQLYCAHDVGKAKVEAITDMICNYTTMRQINAIKGKFERETEPGDIMMCGFDNMRARKTFFNAWLHRVASKNDGEKAKCLYMDGRLSMDTLQILCIRGDDGYNIERYQREFLFSDSEADATICSMKQTTYLACMIGSLMTNLFTNFVASQLDPVIPYDLPFFTEYDAQNMIFKTEN